MLIREPMDDLEANDGSTSAAVRRTAVSNPDEATGSHHVRPLTVIRYRDTIRNKPMKKAPTQQVNNIWKVQAQANVVYPG
jgi:hypothetical protein